MLSLGLRALGRAGVKGAGPGQSSGQHLPGGLWGEGAGGGEEMELGRGQRRSPRRQELGAGTGVPGGARGSHASARCPLPPPPGAPAEAAGGPQGVLRAHQAERHLRALLRQQQQRHPAQAPQHGGPRLRLPLRPRPHPCPHPARGWSYPGPLPPALGCVVACPTQPHVADAGCGQHRSPILGAVLGQPFPTACDPGWSESTWSLRLAARSCSTHHGSGCGSAPCQHSAVRGAHPLGIVY